jgi:hypothetical protein
MLGNAGLQSRPLREALWRRGRVSRPGAWRTASTLARCGPPKVGLYVRGSGVEAEFRGQEHGEPHQLPAFCQAGEDLLSSLA